MSNKTIQLTDGTNNLYPELKFELKTWTPTLYDLNDLVYTFTSNGYYYKIGNLYFCWFTITVNQSLTFSTMLEVRGFPFAGNVLMGQLYVARASGNFGDKVFQINRNGLMRPNFTGTINSGGAYTGFFIGTSD